MTTEVFELPEIPWFFMSDEVGVLFLMHMQQHSRRVTLRNKRIAPPPPALAAITRVVGNSSSSSVDTKTDSHIQCNCYIHTNTKYVNISQTRGWFFNFTNHESSLFIGSSVLLMRIQLMHGLAHLYAPNNNVHTHNC